MGAGPEDEASLNLEFNVASVVTVHMHIHVQIVSALSVLGSMVGFHSILGGHSAHYLTSSRGTANSARLL